MRARCGSSPASRPVRADYQPFDWYSTPRFYDIVFDPLAEEEAAFVQAAFTAHGRARRGAKRVLEPACGSGRVLEALIARGWTAAGFDLNAGMVARAKERCPQARITRQSMQRFRVRGGFDLAYNLVSTFKHLLTEDEAHAHLSRVADVLRPGGLYVLGLHLTEYDDERRQRERWVGERDGTRVVCNIQRWPADWAERTERVRSRLVVTTRDDIRRYESTWLFRTYDEDELFALLDCERRLRPVATYGFDFDITRPCEDPERLDRIVVLQRD